MPTERNARMWQQLTVTACGENICVKIKTNIHWMHYKHNWLLHSQQKHMYAE